MSKWISAFRLRTLPLALSSILMGNLLAYYFGTFSLMVFSLSMITTVFLQVLSNLANDYGDSVHGADSGDRKGPSRAVQSGVITLQQMKQAIIVFTVLSLITGIALLYVAFMEQWLLMLLFLGIGIVAIYAAITYTAGKNPYGYAGLGDVSVFIFFGIVGVIGAYFVQTKTIDWVISLPAISCGAFATGVLNVNNIRDIESDAIAGKRSIPVRIGRRAAILYHGSLLTIGWVSMTIFLFNLSTEFIHWIVFLSFPLFIINFLAVKSKEKAHELDPYLKQLALSTLLFVFLFGVSIFL